MYPEYYQQYQQQQQFDPDQLSAEHGQDERFFPFIPFLGGLAIGGLLFNRPYGYPAPYPVPYPAYGGYPAPGGYPVPGGYPGYGGGYPAPGGFPMAYNGQQVTENINIYPR